MAVIVEVLTPETASGVVLASSVVVDVLAGTSAPVSTVSTHVAVVDTVNNSGVVANVSWGFDFPASPTDGQIFIKVAP